MGRIIGCVSSLVAAMALWLAGSAAHAQGAGQTSRNLAGVWLLDRAVPALQASDGKPIPWTQAGRAAFARRVADLASGKATDDTKKYCQPDGIPRLLTQPMPFEVVQTPGMVTFLHEAHHVYRIVPLDIAQADPDAVNLTFMGNSVGRWDGDTLVIDSIGFNDRTSLDAAGMPHSEALHVVERWHTSDRGRRLGVDVQIEDPALFSRPWSTHLSFVSRPDLTIQEYVCGEPHRRPVAGARK